MSSRKLSFTISYREFLSIESLAEIDKLLLDKAIEAADNAYARYSNFRVGASVLLEGGIIKIGSNQENAAYPSGLCAERVAVFSAAAENPNRIIEKILIIAKGQSDEIKEITPCGACRQVLKEYEDKQDQNIEIIISSSNGKFIHFKNVDCLLPFAFKAEQLDK